MNCAAVWLDVSANADGRRTQHGDPRPRSRIDMKKMSKVAGSGMAKKAVGKAGMMMTTKVGVVKKGKKK